MNEPNTLGAYLRRERERRGITLRAISESTKVSVALLDGLEADDISRWPGGIFRRAFVRSYAQCVGLDPDDVVKRFERQHPPAEAEGPITPPAPVNGTQTAIAGRAAIGQPGIGTPQRARLLGTAADLGVAAVIAFGFAAAGSRLLWPVLLIAAYYAIGVLLTGTSPMVALLNEAGNPAPRPTAPEPRAETAARPPVQPPAQARPQARRTSERPRQRRHMRA